MFFVVIAAAGAVFAAAAGNLNAFELAVAAVAVVLALRNVALNRVVFNHNKFSFF